MYPCLDKGLTLAICKLRQHPAVNLCNSQQSYYFRCSTTVSEIARWPMRTRGAGVSLMLHDAWSGTRAHYLHQHNVTTLKLKQPNKPLSVYTCFTVFSVYSGSVKLRDSMHSHTYKFSRKRKLNIFLDIFMIQHDSTVQSAPL